MEKIFSQFCDYRILTFLFGVGAVAVLFFFLPLGIHDAHASSKTKTVEYFFFQYESATNISANNGIKNTAWPATCDGNNNASTTISIPESSVTIRSAWIEWRTIIEGATTAAGDMRFCRQGQAASSISFGSINTDTAESQLIVIRQDVTNEIVAGTATYFFNARLDNTIRNTDSVKIIITYEYDPSSTTQLKTNKYFVGCRASQAPSNTIDAFTVNPNISETSVTIESNWIEYNGQTPGSGSTDLQLEASINAATSSTAVVDNVNRTAMDFLVLANISSATVNLTANNDINLKNSANTANVKCAEWVITYSYSHYGAGTTHSATSRYFLGQTSGFLTANTTTTIGSNAVNLPENSITFRSVWARYVFDTSKDDTINVVVDINGTATTTSNGYKVDVGSGGRSSGKVHILFDITSFFTSNWTNGATVNAFMATPTASSIEAVSAEIIITYSFNAQNTDTALKSIGWFMGQDTAKNSGGTAFTGSFSPIISEATTTITRRNSAALVDFIMGSAGTVETTTIDDTIASGTDTQGITIETNGESTTYQTILKTTTQWTNATNTNQTVDFTFNVTGATHTDGGMGYLTYEYIFNAVPTLSGVSLNGGSAIILIENTTTSVLVTGIITDTDGDANISSATSTIYLTSVAGAEACAANDVNCYSISASNCILEAANGDNDRAVTCTAALWFLAERSDDDAETWTGFISAVDGLSAYGTGTAIGEVNTLQALDVTTNISYGLLSFGVTTSIANQLIMQVTTTGNQAMDVTIQATNDMCQDGVCGGNEIPACQQQYSTNTAIEYEDAGDGFAEAIELASSSVRNLALESATPTTHTGNTSDEADNIYWKIGIPTGQTIATYNGTTTIISKADTDVSDIDDIPQCN